MKKAIKCGCGRSPTGYCIGWHGLSEEQYSQKKTSWEEAKTKNNVEELSMMMNPNNQITRVL